MAVNLSPVGGVAAQFFTNTGAVLTGGKIYTYAAGTTTPAVAYTSSNGATAWTNPIVLDAAGRVSGSGEIWLTDGINYKFVLKDSNDVLIATYDNVSGINSNFVAFVNQQEIVTATAGQTVFNLSIDYAPATNSLSVFVDGVNQYGPGAQYAYTETDSNTVTFTSGLHVGAEVKFTTSQLQGGGAVDASQVSYIPPFTGSVATNVELKLAQTVSVIDFGAVGDGTTDDTAAIQAAQDASTSVYFPAGTYLTKSKVLVSAGRTFFGDGGEVSVIKMSSAFTPDGSGDLLLFDGQNGTAKKCSFDNLGFDMNKAAFVTPPALNKTFAIYMFGLCDDLIIRDCVFRNLYTGSHIVSQGANVLITNNQFLNSGFDDPAALQTNPIQINGSSVGVIISNNYFDSTVDFHLGLEPDCTNILVEGNIFYNKFTTAGSGAIGGFGSGPLTKIDIRGNLFSMAASPGYTIHFGTFGAGTITFLNICNNTFYSGKGSTILMTPQSALTTGYYKDIQIIGNNFFGNASTTVYTQSAIQLLTTTAGATNITDVVIADNTFKSYLPPALIAQNATKYTIKNNKTFNCGTSSAQKAPYRLINDGTYNDYVNIAFQDNYAYDSTSSNLKLLFVDTATPTSVINFLINGNSIVGAAVTEVVGLTWLSKLTASSNYLGNNLLNGVNQNYSLVQQNASTGVMNNVGVSSFTLAASSSMDVAYIDFDSAYGAAVIEIATTGTGASGAGFVVFSQQHIAFNNGTPSLSTINTDKLTNATLALSFVSGNRMKVTVTSTVAQIVRGGTRITLSGGGSNISGSAGATLTMI